MIVFIIIVILIVCMCVCAAEEEEEVENPNSLVHKIKNEAEFENQLESSRNKLVVVDFFATWCGPCRAISPNFDRIASKYSEKINAVKVDVDKCSEISAKYNVTCMPTFVFIKEGVEVHRFSGGTANDIERTIIQHTS